MEEKKRTGLARQLNFLDQFVKNKPFDFGIVVAKAFLEGMRKIGYKNTAFALFESIDNSIQAEANNVHVIFDWNKGKSGAKEPDRIAILDDGYGMDKDMIRVAALWGGSDRVNNRDGLGRFGYGLPSSCVSIGQKFTIFSKLSASKDWWFVPMDIEEIGNNNPFYINKDTGRFEAPVAQLTELPTFIKSYMLTNKLKYDSGTVVVIEKIDTLSHKNFGKLKDFLITETGICYRNYLDRVNISIDGTKIIAIDPLFTTEAAKFYDEDYERAEAVPSMHVPIKDVGTITVRFSYMTPTFLRVPEEKLKLNGKNNARFDIRKDNNGVIVLRAGRQIDVVSSKSPFVFQNNDRYIGIELDFPPTLDEYFSVTTAKQQIVIDQRIWDILRDAGFNAAFSDLKVRYSKESKEITKKIKHLRGLSQEEKVDYVEQIMTESAQEFEINDESKPKHITDDATAALKVEIDKRVAEALPKAVGVDEDTVRQKVEAELEVEISDRPYKLDFIHEEEGTFFRPKQIGGQVVIYINKAHRFYSDLYENPDTSQFTKNALIVLLFSIGHSELRTSDEKKRWYSQERKQWAHRLEVTLEKLIEKAVTSNKHNTPDDDEVFDAEIHRMKKESQNAVSKDLAGS